MNTEQKVINQAKDGTLGQILDAALALYADIGPAHTKASDIIQASGVGRSTFYRYFNNREEVLAQAIIRDLELLMIKLSDVLEREPTVDGKLIEGMVFCLQEFRISPVLKLLTPESASDMIHEIGLNDENLRRFGAEFCKPIYDQAVDQERIRQDVSLELFVEWITRILISLTATPTQDQQDNIKMRIYLKNFFIPAILKTNY